MMIERISGIAAILLYLVVAAWLVQRLSATQSTKHRLLMVLGFAGMFLHGVALFNTVFTPDGLNMSFFYSVSLVGWLAAMILLIASLTKPVHNLGIAVYPIAAVALSLQFFLRGHNIIAPAGDWQIQSHILFSLFASSTLYLAAMQAILLHIQDSHLHKHHPGGFVRALPPLRIMESLLFEIITLGFLLLSIALVTGVVFVKDLTTGGHLHKLVLSSLAWMLFAILLYGRLRFGWRGRTAITWTIGGFAALVLAYFGTKLVLELILHR